MKTLLVASLLALGLASPVLAQSNDPGVAGSDAGIAGARTGAEAVGDASILPGAAGSAAGGSVDGSTTRSVAPSVSIPDVSVPNATLPNVNRPGTGIDGTITPRSSGSIPNSLNGNGAGVPGSTSTGPAAGGSSGY